MLKKANPALIRSINADLVLRLIRDAGPVSRAEVARRSQLSSPAASDVVSALVRRQLVREEGVGVSTGGRRPKLLRFVPGAALAIGLDLDGEEIQAGLVDLAGAVIREARSPVRRGDVGQIARAIGRVVREMLRGRGRGRVAGVAIGVPGVVSPDTQTVSFAPSLRWEKVDLRRSVQAALGLPVWVENRANAAALGEFWRGVGEGWRDLVFVTIRVGIGAGIILGGQLYRGVSGAAGEIGYMAVDRTALRRRPDDFGALEALASSRALVDRLAVLTPRGAGGPRTPMAVLAAAQTGDRAAARVVRDAVQAWGMAVANLAAVLNPDLVVMGGSIADAGDWIIEQIRSILEQLIPVPPRVVSSALGGQAVLLGCAAQVFSELYGLGPHFPSRLVTLAGGQG